MTRKGATFLVLTSLLLASCNARAQDAVPWLDVPANWPRPNDLAPGERLPGAQRLVVNGRALMRD